MQCMLTIIMWFQMQHTWDACITKISKKKELISHKKIMYAQYIGEGNSLLNQITISTIFLTFVMLRNTISSKYVNIET